MKTCNEQICLKLASTLRRQLELEAAERGRSLSNLIRKILVEHTAQRIIGRSTTEGTAA